MFRNYPLLNRLFYIVGLLFFFSFPGIAQQIDDISASYSFLRITKASLEGEVERPEYYRHFLEFRFGKGPAIMGIQYQRATKPNPVDVGTAESGLMAIAGYDLILAGSLRLESLVRLGLLSETDPSQPLYATDTDFRLNLVFFNEDGLGWSSGSAFFPSLYAGGIINRYGRVQAIGGIGNWWKNIGLYFTAFHSFNGVEDPLNPGSDKDILYANLQESGMSFSLSYEIKDFQIFLKQNQPLKNGGNDLTLTLQYQLFFDE